MPIIAIILEARIAFRWVIFLCVEMPGASNSPYISPKTTRKKNNRHMAVSQTARTVTTVLIMKFLR